MNEKPYNSSYSDGAILRQIGEFIQSTRIDQNLTQDELANKAALSRSTISLVERGENISLTNLLKILRILDALYVLEQFKVEPQVSPLQMAKEDRKKRRRAARKNTETYGDDVEW